MLDLHILKSHLQNINLDFNIIGTNSRTTSIKREILSHKLNNH